MPATRSFAKAAAKKKPGDNRKAFATPTLSAHQGQRQLISPAAEVTISYDPPSGVVTCLDAQTGDEIWKQRLNVGQNHWTSPLAIGETICFFSKEGDVSVIAASREFQVLHNHQFDEGIVTGPAITGNSLLLRSEGHRNRVAEFEEIAPQ